MGSMRWCPRSRASVWASCTASWLFERELVEIETPWCLILVHGPADRRSLLLLFEFDVDDVFGFTAGSVVAAGSEPLPLARPPDPVPARSGLGRRRRGARPSPDWPAAARRGPD